MSTTIPATSTLVLGHAGEWWDFWMMISLVAAVVVAAAVAFTTTSSVLAHKREAEAANLALEKYKLETVGKVADAHTAGVKAGTQAADAHAVALKAQAELETAKATIAEANARGVEAGERTEKMRAVNIRLQAALRPRRLAVQSRGSDETIRLERFNEVAKYAGTRAIIQVVPDFESRILASDIGSTLERAGWRVEFTEEPVSHIPSGSIGEGVQLATHERFPFSPGKGPNEPPVVTEQPMSRAGHAALAAAGLLSLDLGPPYGPALRGVTWARHFSEEQAQSWLFRTGFNFPDGAVVVLVGMKPLDASMMEIGFEAAQAGPPEPKPPKKPKAK